MKIYSTNFNIKSRHRLVEQVTRSTGPGGFHQKKYYYNMDPGMNITIIDEKYSPRPVLYVQSSIPKLLYGTSNFEVKESDKGRVIQILRTKLEHAGISIADNNLGDFTASRVDFSRNIKVDGKIEDYIVFLTRFNLNRHSKQVHKHETLSFKNKSSELIFYDKIKEILDKEKSEKIFNLIHNKNENILRIEKRLLRKRVIEREVGNNLHLSDFFDFDLSTKILLNSMNTLTGENIVSGFSFNDYLGAMNILGEKIARNHVDEFLKLMGLKEFLARCGSDWTILQKFISASGLSKRQVTLKLSDYKQSM